MTRTSTAYRTAGQTRTAAASEATARARRIGRFALWASAIVLALGLGTGADEARAQACQAKNIKAKPGCVTDVDIGKKKKKPALNQKDRKDEAGVALDDNPLQDTRVEPSDALGPSKIFTGFELNLPAKGVVVIRASGNLLTVGDTFGAVECDILADGTALDNRKSRIRGFAGSVDVSDGFPSDSMTFLTAFEVEKKGTLELDMVCGLMRAIANNATFDPDNRRIVMNSPNLVAHYFPTRYCRKKRDGTCR